MLWKSKALLVVSFLFAHTSISSNSSMGSTYLLGVGIGDVTGPIVETNMMGYADLAQTDTGLHMRQRSRAFIIADAADPSNRLVFVNSDIGMGDTAARVGIIQKLQALYPGVYDNSNVALVGTHQHSGVAGFHNYLLPQITSLGFVRQSYEAIVNGSVTAVIQAHNSLKLGTLTLGNTTLLDTSVNRSPHAYLANPAFERAKYQYDQDKDFTLLKFTDSAAGDPRGFLSFFAVHGTSLYSNNTLVSTDNKGMAAYLYESYVNPNAFPGMNNSFVAGFAQANVGDTSPNTLGAYCESPGKPWDGHPCEFTRSTCGNITQDCHGRGPGFRISDFESNRIIGLNQFNAAKALMEGSSLVPVSGAVKALHTYIRMSNYSFTLANGTKVNTCPGAMGYSFAGGTTDGPGAFDFIQGDNSTQSQNPFWELVKGAATPYPSQEQIDCHHPKPILLNTGYAHTPYEWTPAVVDIQIFQVGQLVMLIVPSEFTTMAGRRIRDAVRAKLISSGVLDNSAYVVIVGPSNVYSHYVTTREEYAIQRFEGASTIYGPYTLEAYIDIYTNLVRYLKPSNTAVLSPGPTPPDQVNKSISLQRRVVYDTPGFGHFGQVLTDVRTKVPYEAGRTVFAVFRGANPRNNLRLEGTFLTVDKLIGSHWNPVRTDSHPSTTLTWNRTSDILGTSITNITWTIENGTPAGTYRLTYYGDSKSLTGSITAFVGHSSPFTILV